MESQKRAALAIKEGRFAEEIVAVAVGSGKKATTVAVDEGPRPETTLEGLAKLGTAFKTDGTVTAGQRFDAQRRRRGGDRGGEIRR